jgi:LacI family transcriptional regulator
VVLDADRHFRYKCTIVCAATFPGCYLSQVSLMRQPPSITLKRIADQLGVSVTTVSRSLGGQARRYRISRKTEQTVQELARSLGFSPNYLARGLRLRKTATIGLVIPDVSNPFFADIARQIAIGARDYRYSVIVCDSQETEELEIESLALLRGRGVEGIVLCPVGRSAEHLAEFQDGDPPIVLADRYFPGLRLAYVASDNFAGARDATAHLIQNGHRRIVCLQGSVGTSPNEDRVRGYRDALRTNGLPLDEALIVGDSFGEQSGYIAMKLLLKKTTGFTAVLALSNLISLGAIRALSEEKIGIPADVSIISFDDQPYSAYLAAPMTTVAQRSSEMGKIAMKLLFDRIRSPQQAVEGGILLPTSLIVRGSVRDLNKLESRKEQHRVCG